MRTKNKVAAALLAAGAAVTLILAVSAETKAWSPDAPSSPTTVATAANPVPILHELHVTTDPGTVYGNRDFAGNQYASGQFADYEQVTVYTFATGQAETAFVQEFGGPYDIDKLLLGKLFIVEVTAVDGASGLVYPEAPATLAQECGAVVQQG